MRRPFARQANHSSSSPLILPTPSLNDEKPAYRRSGEARSEAALKPISREKLEKAKAILEDAGIDPTVLDKLLDRINNIDREIEDLTAELEITKQRISELKEEKHRIYRILIKFLE